MFKLDKAEQQNWIECFRQSGAAKCINLARGLSTASAHTAFSMWFASEQRQEPTDFDLLAFAAVNSVRACKR